MTEPGATTRQKLIDAAIDLMHIHSYPAVGVKSICDEAGVLKGSFYHFFGSKEDLAIAAVDQAWNEYRTLVIEPAIASGQRPHQPTRHAPCTPKADPDSSRNRRAEACMFSRLAASVTDEEPRLRERLSDIFSEWAELLGTGDEGWSALARLQGRLVIAFAVEEGAPA